MIEYDAPPFLHVGESNFKAYSPRSRTSSQTFKTCSNTEPFKFPNVQNVFTRTYTHAACQSTNDAALFSPEHRHAAFQSTTDRLQRRLLPRIGTQVVSQTAVIKSSKETCHQKQILRAVQKTIGIFHFCQQQSFRSARVRHIHGHSNLSNSKCLQ